MGAGAGATGFRSGGPGLNLRIQGSPWVTVLGSRAGASDYITRGLLDSVQKLGVSKFCFGVYTA